MIAAVLLAGLSPSRAVRRTGGAGYSRLLRTLGARPRSERRRPGEDAGGVRADAGRDGATPRGAPPVPGGPSPGDSGARRDGRGGQDQARCPRRSRWSTRTASFGSTTASGSRIFYLDGQKHRREMPNGAKLETVATLTGRVVYDRREARPGKESIGRSSFPRTASRSSSL